MQLEIKTEDGKFVHEGDRVYNYYDMKPGFIVPGSINRFDASKDHWFDVQHDDGTRSILNGQRICTIEFAKRRGFKGA